ncbi:MAG: type II toxin-antitoxin system VapC family toxin [Betaproteobacteria bacterium]|nr:type II toxin-antitoxin system VapC family toxin [Betaproteobacteria bacterium]
MILYFDTSALVKLYVRERGSLVIRRQAGKADAIATSVVAYAEARAAFARLRREKPRSGKPHRERVGQLDRDWDRYVLVELSAAVARSAGELADTHGLRGFDAIHLASALWLKSAYSGDLAFAAFDRKLTAAAASAGLTVVG